MCLFRLYTKAVRKQHGDFATVWEVLTYKKMVWTTQRRTYRASTLDNHRMEYRQLFHWFLANEFAISSEQRSLAIGSGNGKQKELGSGKQPEWPSAWGGGGSVINPVRSLFRNAWREPLWAYVSSAIALSLCLVFDQNQDIFTCRL
jgi:hypothetical protein